MSNKSAGPVKTHQEKLIDKAQKVIKEFWPPELEANASAEADKQSAEIQHSQATDLSESNQNLATDKKKKSSSKLVTKTEQVKTDKNTQNKKANAKRSE